MRKCTAIFLMICLCMGVVGCSNDSDAAANRPERKGGSSNVGESSDSSTENSSSGSTENAENGRILTAYFSWADNAVIEDEAEVDAVSSPSVLSPGHVQMLAGWIQEQAGGDLFSIKVAEPYPSDWDDCLDRANEERAENARPELTERVENIDDYDVVFLGYPNWWYGAPMALLSFIEENDLSGKQIYLFCSHGTGGLAGSVEDIEAVLPGNVSLSDDVFDVYEEDAADAKEEVQDWLTGLGY